ncbi:hypothetical protein MB27_22280 [Actinoplanes utahensis]|uniref:Lipoprotein n=1 Tax=Actinoplanes utahensis TaxID=1869 RepID=A0A0A6UKI0_ACTUT|nr:hypothetical protein MB27_22280 [Actinoplanes utahensis]
MLALAGVLAVAGCSSSEKPAEPTFEASSAPAAPSVAVTAAGVKVGPKGSPCELPFSFDAAADWKPKAVDVKTLGEFAELAKVGEFTNVCEIDAKPAGNIGFLRVYLAEGRSGQPRGHLDAFVKAGRREVSGEVYKDIQVAAQQGAEVTWNLKSTSLDMTTRYSAFAMNTEAGAVVVVLNAFDEIEYEQMLPAFQLAVQSAAVAS